MKTVRIGRCDECPAKKNINVTSPRCQECENHIKMEWEPLEDCGQGAYAVTCRVDEKDALDK